MKKKWIGLRILMVMCAALGWWGFLYPELVLTPETVSISRENEDGTLSPLSDQWTAEGGLLYLDLLGAGKDKITFRSRLLTNLNIFLEAFHDGKAD